MGVYVDDCVCVIRLDMTSPPWWREKILVYYYYIFMAHRVWNNDEYQLGLTRQVRLIHWHITLFAS